jgi:acyl-CoA synthetase (AMP-forming)/AMP-acid ligase II
LKPGTATSTTDAASALSAGVTETELITFLQDRLARYKVPKSVAFLTELPISGAGKILKRELREQFVK